MPFTVDQLSTAGKTALEFHLKNKAEDQVGHERPWLKQMMKTKGSMPGGKENAVVQLRYRYQSNFQFFNGRQQVSYNNRSTIEQASFPWRSAHDGFAIEEDRLIQNGITLLDDKKPVQNSQAERVQLQNLFQEQIEVMDLGFDEQFDQKLLLDGSGGTDDIEGLDHLVATDPTTGTVGGIDRSVAGNSWWRNNFSLGLTTTTTTGTIIDKMEIEWRNCIKNGGRPNFIQVGADFYDGYRNFLLKTYGQTNYSAGDQMSVEGGTEVIRFKGIPMVWNPTFDDLGGTWAKRCYFINTRFMQMKEIQGKISRKPPRPYDRYEHYFGMTWRGALVMTRANAHAVLTIA